MITDDFSVGDIIIIYEPQNGIDEDFINTAVIIEAIDTNFELKLRIPGINYFQWIVYPLKSATNLSKCGNRLGLLLL